jgi:hypothetical protein
VKKLIAFILTVLLITSCNSAGESNEVLDKDIPIEVYSSNEQKVDVDRILSQVKELIKNYMPEGHYRSVYIRGDCDNLQELNGSITFQFVEEKERWFKIQPQIFYASAFVDIKQETLNISVRDETNHYPSTEAYPEVNNELIQKIIESATEKIAALGVEQCSVDITQLKDSWSVLCEPLNDNERKCSFSIDPETYEAIEFIPPK